MGVWSVGRKAHGARAEQVGARQVNLTSNCKALKGFERLRNLQKQVGCKLVASWLQGYERSKTMGIADAFEKEDRVPVKMSTFHAMMKEVVKAEFLMNAVQCKVPHEFIYEMATGTKVEKEQEHE